MAFQCATIGGIGPVLSDTYTLDIAGLGWIVGFCFLSGVEVALPGGGIARRFGDERVILFGLALMMAGSLIMALQPPLSVFSAAPTQGPSGPARLPGPGGKWPESAGTVSAAFEFAACVTVLAILGVFVFLPLSRRV